jgi:hypothetical protein
MKIVVFSSASSLPCAFGNSARYEVILKGLDAIGQKEGRKEDQRDEKGQDLCYLDITGLDESYCKRLLKKIRTAYPDCPWGILDLGGESPDPALFFHEGASDYLGPHCKAEGFTSQRWKRIQEYLGSKTAQKGTAVGKNSPLCPDERSFPGWKSIKSGTIFPFYLLYIGPEHGEGLKTSLGEKRFGELQNRLVQYLTQLFSSVDALLWMQTDTSFLFLIPPEKGRASQVIEDCLRLALNAPLISYEKLHLDFSLPLACAMHYGELPFQPPGKTGTLVADCINFIFHLGYQRAQGGRLVLSEAVEGAIGAPLRDLFVAIEPFEGKKLLQSKRFL